MAKEVISGWNHRIVQFEHEDEKCFQICEVYYEDDSIIAWTDPVEPYGDTVSDLIGELQHMAEAARLPILKERELPTGGAK